MSSRVAREKYRLDLASAIACLCVFLSCGGNSNSSGTGGGNPPPPPPPATVTVPHPSFRTRYLRTDIQYNPNALQFFPPHFTAYDSAHQRFFVSNTTLNRIDVFDASTESQIGSIFVPEPWGIDVSPDGTKMYAATEFGDVYLLDPGAMQVLLRYASSTIGPQGYIATQVFWLANGELALLGAIGGFYLDGSQNFAVWNPATNNLEIIYPGNVIPAQWSGNIGKITATPDRSKVLVGSATSGSILLYDPVSGTGIGAESSSIPYEILATPDGSKIFVVGPQAGIDVYDGTTLAHSGNFTPPAAAYSAALSYDGSSLFVVDQQGSVYAFDTATLHQKGWVSSFQVVDSQSTIVASAVDPTGLMVGPMGHGIGFLDTTQINAGTRGTLFSVSFLTPSFGPLTGGISVEANIGQLVSQPTMYLGNAATQSVTATATSLTTTAPKSTYSGPVDFTVVLPDKSIGMMPENFTYGPTIVEVSTNAASAEGGAAGAIFGYGFGQQPSDVQVTVGGQSATVTQLLVNASPLFPYPFPMEAVLFTVPPGMAGAVADVTVTTSDGTATASAALHYVPAVQSYPLPGASLSQGIYDSYRGVLYFADRAQIDVFSPSTEAWLSPITLPNTTGSTRLMGISLSPDGNTLAVSDPAENAIYVLNPSSPETVKHFSTIGSEGAPNGLAVNDAGIVYFATFAQGISPPGGFGTLDSNSGQVTIFQRALEDADAFTRVFLSPDGSRIYTSEAGYPWILMTSNDSLVEAIQCGNAGNGTDELSLSADGTALTAAGMLTDANVDVNGDLAYVDRDVWLPKAVYGQKLDAHANFVYQPLTNGVDVLDAATGLLQYRVTLPIQIENVYDSLAIDNQDGLLFAITATGIAQLNLSSLSTNATALRFARHQRSSSFRSPQADVKKSHRTNEWLQRPKLRY